MNWVLDINTFANFVKRPQAKAWTAVATTGGTPATHCLGYTSEARLRGLKSLQAAEAAFVRIAAPF